MTGTVRDVDSDAARQLLHELPGLELVAMDLNRGKSIEAALEQTTPDRVFHLAAMSNVRQTWDEPARCVRVNLEGTAHLLEAMRRHAPDARLVYTSSGDCLDHAQAGPEGISPQTPMLSTNPYSISKAAAMQLLHRYREQFGLQASVAIPTNHTSPRRGNQFVEKKIVHEAVEVAAGKREKLELGSMEAKRDWAWAEDVVEGLAAMADREKPADYVLASGKIHTTGDWVRSAFAQLGLDLEKHLQLNTHQLHPGDRPHVKGDIRAAAQDLGWSPQTSLEVMVERLIADEKEKLAAEY